MLNLITDGLVEKIYITDTSAWIHHPSCSEVLGSEGNLVIIPWTTIREIDGLKTRQDLKGASAREASRRITSYRQQSLEQKKSLKDGIQTKNGGWIAVDHFSAPACENVSIDLPENFDPKTKADDQIIYTALQWKTRYSNIPVTLISRDNTLLLAADILGLNAEDYEHDTVLNSIDDLYSGIINIQIDPNNAAFINDLYQKGAADECDVFDSIGKTKLTPNQCCVFIGKDNNVVALAVYKCADKLFRAVNGLNQKRSTRRFVPWNIGQAFAYAHLTDPGIHMVTITGRGGTGKTLVTLWAGANQLDNPYHELLVFRPIVEMGGRSLGYLKGTLEEKFLPWTGPILDNLGIVEMGMENRAMANELQSCRLKMEPLIHVRGRSIHDKFILVDDSQNLTPHEAKTISTRPAGKSKLVMVGDPDPLQIDEPYLTPISNGLVYAIQRMKGSEIFAHVTLTETVRSELSKEAAERM